MRRALIALAGAGLLLGLAACGDPPTVGTVYRAPYTGESYWYSTHCGLWTSVTRTSYSTVYDSKGRASGSRATTRTEQVCVLTLQDRHVNPPYWELCLRADDDPKHKGCFRVPQDVQARYPVGTHYPDAR